MSVEVHGPCTQCGRPTVGSLDDAEGMGLHCVECESDDAVGVWPAFVIMALIAALVVWFCFRDETTGRFVWPKPRVYVCTKWDQYSRSVVVDTVVADDVDRLNYLWLDGEIVWHDWSAISIVALDGTHEWHNSDASEKQARLRRKLTAGSR